MIKKFLLKVLQFVLKKLARATIKKYKPTIIGVTGSVGKSTTKEAIFTVLKQEKKVRASRASLNNEIGLPLAILGNYENMQTAGGFLFWFNVVGLAILNLIHRIDYPEILVLEYGAGRPKDIDYLLSVARPDIVVVTAIGKIPVHVEFYSGPAEVAKEETKLVGALPPKGWAILNYDDELVLSAEEKFKNGSVITFGFNEKADIRIIGFENKSDGRRPVGVVFKLKQGENFVPIKIEGTFGKGLAYAGAAAGAVASIFNINLVKVSSALMFLKPLPGRAKLIRGIKSSYIIDDSYNASPASVQEGLEIIKELEAERKVVILGDMRELGKYAIEAHQEIGRLAGQIGEVIIAIGESAKFIAEQAKQTAPDKKILVFEDSETAKLEVQKIIQSGDLIFIKGSQSMRMEKITLEIMERPELAAELLPRQYGKWLKG